MHVLWEDPITTPAAAYCTTPPSPTRSPRQQEHSSKPQKREATKEYQPALHLHNIKQIGAKLTGLFLHIQHPAEKWFIQQTNFIFELFCWILYAGCWICKNSPVSLAP